MRHFTEQQISDYFDRKLPAAELLRLDDHLQKCEDCAARMSSIENISGKAVAALTNDPSVDIHLDYDQLAAYADNKIDDVDREIVDVHAKACDFCADQLKEIVALREQLASSEISPKKSHPSRAAGLLSFLFRVAVPAFGLVAVALIIWALWPARRTEEIAAIVPEPANAIVSPSPGTSLPGNETNAASGNAEKTPALVKLVDGGSIVELMPDGSVTGVEPAFEAKIAKILKSGEISVDDSAKQLRSGRGVLMGDNEPGESFSVTSPVGKILLNDRPDFRWNAVKDADSYEVNIFDSNFNPVAASGPLKTNRWTPPRSLKRGNIYQWQVTANVGSEKIKSPVQPAGSAKFKIVDAAKAAEIEQARKTHPNQHLTLGLLYAEAGLINDAVREFEQLSRANPNAELPKRLLKEVRSKR